MRNPLFNPKAAKQTVSLTLNSELYAKAKGIGINASRIAEDALAHEYTERCRDILIAEIRQDLAAVHEYEEQHGAFADLVREHYEREDGPV